MINAWNPKLVSASKIFFLRASYFVIFLLILSVYSCSEKTVTLADGRMVTQRKYDRMIQHALNTAEKDARKAVKGKMTRKQIREFENSEAIPVELNMP
jgi:hypothetical protein